MIKSKDIQRDQLAHEIIKFIVWTSGRIPKKFFTDKDRYIVNLQTQSN